MTVYTEGEKHTVPALESAVVSTAGAGDAMIGAVMGGLVMGLPLVGDESAVALGNVASHFAVESKDTISMSFTKEEAIKLMKGV